MAVDAITHDDSGTERVPASAAAWDEWVSASSTRNHVLSDPLLDWLDRHGESKGFVLDEADERTDFLAFIFGKGVEFERAVVKHLRGRIGGDVRTIGVGSPSRGAARTLSLAVDTWSAMNDGVAVIDQGVLWDPEHRTYGLPDLLVRSDVLAGLFPGALSSLDAAVKAPDLDIGECHYVVVDIKYTTLRFTATGKLSNSGSIAAYKVQLHIYNRALARLQGYLAPQAFLLGRGWEQTVDGATTRIGDCANRVACVEHDENTPGGPLNKLADGAANWMRYMRRCGDNWDAL